MKTRIFTLILSLFITTMAFPAVVDGIEYNFSSSTAEVAKPINKNYSGDIIIPSSVKYKGNTYIVTSIHKDAFWFSGITSIYIPATITNIYDETFRGCDRLTSVAFAGNNLTNIGRSAFLGCSKLTSITIPNCKIQPYSELRIAAKAFCYCESLTSIDIPNNAVAIGGDAFYGCKSLTSVTINSNNIIGIGDLFEGCTSLTSIKWNVIECEDDYCSQTPFYSIKDQINNITFGSNIKSIPNYLCCGLSNLTSIDIPSNVTSIGNSSFEGCTSLTSIDIPSNVTSIGNRSFAGCTSLTSIDIPNKVTSIGPAAFDGCSSLTSIIIPNSVTKIGNYAFYECSSLTSITIPNNVTSIGTKTFYKCSSLTSVTIGSSVNYIATDAFNYCPELANIVVNSNNGVFNSKNKCNAIIFTSENKLIKGGKNTIIPSDVRIIGEYAFHNSSLISITIPNSVTSIDSYAFYSCSSINELIVEATNPPSLANYAFVNVPKSIQVKVPCNSISTYQTTEGWKYFTNFVGVGLPPLLTINVNDASMGVATITKQNSCEDNIAQVEAKANAGYKFVRWSDGNTENPRKITVTEDMTLTAEFAIDQYQVTLKSNGNGSVTGSGTYDYGTKVTIEAIANKGYHFEKWSDGNTENPRTITVTENINLTAEFAIDQYQVTLKSNGNGSVTGSGTYDYGTKVTIEAIADKGYHFEKWSDGNTENPRTITVTEDIELSATFELDETPVENVQITSANVYSRNGILHVEGAETDYYVLDMAGKLIYSGHDTELQLPRGVYVVNVGGEVQKVVL